MFRSAALFAFSLLPILVFAQTPEPGPWKWTAMAGLNGAQAQYRDWAPGGVNAVSATGSFLAKGVYTKGAIAFSSELNLKYGGSKIEDIGFQKTDDQILFQNNLNYTISGSAWSYYALLNFNTQFYDGVKDGLVISEFMAPAYLNEGAGFAYKPSTWFSAKGGLALKQTYVSDTLFATGFGVDAGKNWRNEAGFSFGAKLEREIMKNVLLKSSLDTFSNLSRTPADTDVLFSNELVGKINKYLSTNFQLVLAYDSDIVKRVQVKQVLSVGMSFQLF